MSGLDFQLVDVKFTQGLETQTSKKLVIPGKWNLLQNCTLSVNGALTKRDGTTHLVSTALGNGLATFNDELLAINGTAVSSISSPTLNPASIGASALPVAGQLGFVQATKTEIARGGDFPEGGDVAHGGGFTCYVWAAYTAAGGYDGVYCTVLDEFTGTRVVQKTQVSVTGVRPRVVFSVNAFFIFYVQPAGPDLVCFVITTTAGVLTAGLVVNLITSASLMNKNFDACEFMNSSTVGSVAVSYVWGDGVTSVRAIRVTQTATVPSIATGPINLITEAQIPNLSVFGLGVCFLSSTVGSYATFIFATAGGATSGTVVKILDNTFASAAAFLQVDATVPLVAAACHVCAVGLAARDVAVVFTDQQSSIAAAAALVPLRRTEINFTAGVITVVSSVTLRSSAVAPGGGPTLLAPPRGPFIAGKPFAAKAWDSGGPGTLVNGALMLPVAIVENHTAASTNTTNLQPTLMLMDGVSGVIVARCLYGTYGVGGPLAGVPLVYTPSSTPVVNTRSSKDFATYALAAGEKGTFQFSNGVSTTQNGIVRVSFTPQLVTAPARAQLGASTYLGGGSLTAYDALGLTEAGFPLFPEGLAVVSAAGLLPAGTYSACALYEWVDGQGQRHQSAPSLPISFTSNGGAAGSFTIACPTLLISQKTGVTLVLYVTQAGGVTFSRVTPMTAPVLNTTAAVLVTFPPLAAAASVTSVAGNELLYSQPFQSGTTLPNNAPGPTSALAVHQNRLFVDRTDKPGAYAYSQPLTNGTGLQWNETLGGMIPSDGGKLVGLVDMDDKVILLCSRKLYYVAGTGPATSGAFNGYSEPIEILSDVGCSSRVSILKTPVGVMFKSLKGFQMLRRDLSVQYIGSAVTAYDGYEVFSATMLEDQQEARFTLGFAFRFGQGSTELGVNLVYSYVMDQWSTTVITVTPPAAAARNFVGYDSVWWPTLQLFIQTSLVDGLIRDTPGTYDDNLPITVSSPVIPSARTSFLHLSTLGAFQRVRWLYLTASLSPAQTNATGVSIVVDYDDVYSAVTPPGSTGAYTATGSQALTTYGTGGVIDFRHKLRRQKCKSIAFTFSNLNTFANLAGILGFEALTLEVGMKRGTQKLSAAQTVT